MFFKKLSEILPEGVDLNFTIRKADGELTVLVSPSALGKVQPMSIKGTPDDLDKEFHSTIGSALNRTNGLMVQTKQYEEKLKEKTKDLEKKLEEKKKDPKPKTKDTETEETGGGMFDKEDKDNDDND